MATRLLKTHEIKHLLSNENDIGFVCVDKKVRFIDYRVLLAPVLVNDANTQMEDIFGTYSPGTQIFLNFDFLSKLHQVDAKTWTIQERFFVVKQKREMESVFRESTWEAVEETQEPEEDEQKAYGKTTVLKESKSFICTVKIETQPVFDPFNYEAKWNGKTVQKIVVWESKKFWERYYSYGLNAEYEHEHYYFYEDNSYTVVYLTDFEIKKVEDFEPVNDVDAFLEKLKKKGEEDKQATVGAQLVSNDDLYDKVCSIHNGLGLETWKSFEYLRLGWGDLSYIKTESVDAYKKILDLFHSY